MVIIGVTLNVSSVVDNAVQEETTLTAALHFFLPMAVYTVVPCRSCNQFIFIYFSLKDTIPLGKDYGSDQC